MDPHHRRAASRLAALPLSLVVMEPSSRHRAKPRRRQGVQRPVPDEPRRTMTPLRLSCQSTTTPRWPSRRALSSLELRRCQSAMEEDPHNTHGLQPTSTRKTSTHFNPFNPFSLYTQPNPITKKTRSHPFTENPTLNPTRKNPFEPDPLAGILNSNVELGHAMEALMYIFLFCMV